MSKSSSIDRVSIRPGVSVLSVLAHLNYRPWFALGEFVDNAIQSYSSRRKELLASDPNAEVLRVTIEVDAADGGRITIRDNAAGISADAFPRAFRPAQLPADRSGLGEFGMGMKSAACWFAKRWSVRTSAVGEPVERSVHFDIDRIVRDSIDELDVQSSPISTDAHFTEIVLMDLHHVPVGRTIGKIRMHLQDIYRIFAAEGMLDLRLGADVLQYQEPEVLVAPFHRTPNSSPVRWRKDFDFDFGTGLRAHGFAAIRKTASSSGAGFALFRRKRLIQGSGDDGYRPEYIFGKPNTFPFQRVFGEIHIEGFEVSHTKDGFQWDENEQPFLELLREQLMEEPLPLLQQAREYRVERGRDDYRRGAVKAAERTSEALQDHLPEVLPILQKASPPGEPPKQLRGVEILTHRIIDVELQHKPWRIVLELSADPAVGDWLEISDQIAEKMAGDVPEGCRVVGLRLALMHPFMQRFSGIDCDEIEPLLRIAAAIGLGEVAARDAGARMAGAVRRNVNELLRTALAHT